MTKLNKQGVRDLNYIGKRTEDEFGKNQLPGELAAKLLEGKPAEFGEALSAETEEFLEILAEECAETIQRATKVLRFGLRISPWDHKHTRDKLEAEAGDILAALDVLEELGVVSHSRIQAWKRSKLHAFVNEVDPLRPRLRHITPALRAKIKERLNGR